MALYLATIKNRIYTFEYYSKDDILEKIQPSAISAFNILYDVTNKKIIKCRYDVNDLTPDAIDMLRWHASHINIGQLEEAVLEAWPTIK